MSISSDQHLVSDLDPDAADHLSQHHLAVVLKHALISLCHTRVLLPRTSSYIGPHRMDSCTEQCKRYLYFMPTEFGRVDASTTYLQLVLACVVHSLKDAIVHAVKQTKVPGYLLRLWRAVERLHPRALGDD